MPGHLGCTNKPVLCRATHIATVKVSSRIADVTDACDSYALARCWALDAELDRVETSTSCADQACRGRCCSSTLDDQRESRRINLGACTWQDSEVQESQYSIHWSSVAPLDTLCELFGAGYESSSVSVHLEFRRHRCAGHQHTAPNAREFKGVDQQLRGSARTNSMHKHMTEGDSDQRAAWQERTTSATGRIDLEQSCEVHPTSALPVASCSAC